MQEREVFESECRACRALRFASEIGDDSLADAIRVFSPPHSCKVGEKDAADAADAADAEARERMDSLKSLDTISFNVIAERRFVAYLAALLRVEGALPVGDVLRECAYDLDVSVETIKRYLLKHSARRARFCVVDGQVRLRR